MKKFILLMIVLLIITSCSKDKEINIYAYSSASWIEKELLKDFEKENNIKVNFIKFEGAAEIGSRLMLEKQFPKSDIVIGLTPSISKSLSNENMLKAYELKDKKKYNSNLMLESKLGIVYDYGALAFVYDPKKISIQSLTSFEDLLKLKKSIIIQDPRISSVGREFLLWTVLVYKGDWQEYWKKLKESILVVTPGWSEAFAKFEAGEGEMMLSYITDKAYNIHNYGKSKYETFIPEEGGYFQKEIIALVNKNNIKNEAKKFIEFMLSENVQKKIPLNQWMIPAKDVELPSVFSENIPKNIKEVSFDDEINEGEILKKWEEIMLN